MKYTKPTVDIVSVDSINMICSSHKRVNNVNKYEAPDVVKELYSDMTLRQKAAAMNLMFVLAGSCPPNPSCISQIDKIMGMAANNMQISANQYKSLRDSFGGVQGMIDELKGVHNKGALDTIFLSLFSVVSVGRSEQAMQALLNIYSQLGYSEDDCLEIVQKANALSGL